ncbi:MAG: hypothetical protein QOK23_3308 [Gammaproteobacteria bacterium]|jgi:y4mF family transcriptional regulator|nr:hypothetical protein [Gammaproteobacteria bacterium]
MWAQSAAEIGKIVAAARQHHRLTQAALGQAIGASQKWVSEVEAGKETAQIGKVLRALSHLGVRLQSGIAPWDEKVEAGGTHPAISLSDIISANAVPQTFRRTT